MAILSIQSHVVYGYVGNTAAAFPLQRLGHDVWAINTVEFSNHTGYGSWRGSVLDPALVGELVGGLKDRQVLGQCEAVLSGYLGNPLAGNAVLEAVREVRRAVPNLVYCCDPVMGDVATGFYVHPEIPRVFKERIIPLADILTPNQFELEALTGIRTDSFESAKKALTLIHETGPGTIMVTSYKGMEIPRGEIGMLVSGDTGLFCISTPELPMDKNMAGSGDLTAALFLSRYLQSRDISRALELTAASVYGIIDASCKAGSMELQIVKNQAELVNPSSMFRAERI